MFLPIRDAPNPPGVAVVNYALIAVNVAVFLLITVPLGLQELDPNDPAAAEFLRQRVELYGRQALQVPASAYDIVVHRYGYRPAPPRGFSAGMRSVREAAARASTTACTRSMRRISQAALRRRTPLAASRSAARRTGGE